MSKKAILLLAIAMAVLILAAPAAADGPEPVGERLSLFPGATPETWPADTPFYIAHGWAFLPPADIPGPGLGFSLTLDGEPQAFDFVSRTVAANPGQGPTISWLWVYNFPDGLTAGTHMLTGEWLASCSYAVKLGLYPGPCSSPNEIVVTSSNTVSVEFVAP